MVIKYKSRRVMGDHKGLHGYLRTYPEFKRYNVPRNEIWIRKGQRNPKATVRHEKVEVELMKNKHMGYRKAHRIASRYG